MGRFWRWLRCTGAAVLLGVGAGSLLVGEPTHAQEPECEWGTLINGFLVITVEESQAHLNEIPSCVEETPMRTSKMYGLDLPPGQFGPALVDPGPLGGFVSYESTASAGSPVLSISWGGRGRTPTIVDTQSLTDVMPVDYLPGPGVLLALPDGAQAAFWDEPEGVFVLRRDGSVNLTMEDLAARLVVLAPEAPEVGNSPAPGNRAAWPPMLAGGALAVLAIIGAAAVVRRD